MSQNVARGEETTESSLVAAVEDERPRMAETYEGQRLDPSVSSNGKTDHAQEGRRLNVNFSGEAYEELAQLAKQSGKSISETVREAIALKRWYERTKQEGWRVLLERDGRVREVVGP
ncbi:MAG: hypothetical protein QOF33_1115 [Thermomicrobiales bacterium]|jgi:predicted CopG family antitoxin|nr:hypothetical protein [Thermomicrobiales bacterium]